MTQLIVQKKLESYIVWAESYKEICNMLVSDWVFKIFNQSECLKTSVAKMHANIFV